MPKKISSLLAVVICLSAVAIASPVPSDKTACGKNGCSCVKSCVNSKVKTKVVKTKKMIRKGTKAPAAATQGKPANK